MHFPRASCGHALPQSFLWACAFPELPVGMHFPRASCGHALPQSFLWACTSPELPVGMHFPRASCGHAFPKSFLWACTGLGVLLLRAWLGCLLVGRLTSQQRVSVYQVRICSDKFICCHTEIEVAHQTFYSNQLQYTDTGLTSPCADATTPGAWQGSHWSANF